MNIDRLAVYLMFTAACSAFVGHKEGLWAIAIVPAAIAGGWLYVRFVTRNDHVTDD